MPEWEERMDHLVRRMDHLVRWTLDFGTRAVDAWKDTPYTYREAHEGEIYRAPHRYSDNLPQMERALRQASRCWVMEVGGTVVSRIWTTERRPRVHVHGLLTDPQHRGHRYGFLLMAWVLSRYRAAGFTEAWGTVANWNVAQIRNMARLGFTPDRLRSPLETWVLDELFREGLGA